MARRSGSRIIMTCQKPQTCRECVESGQAWGLNGGCSICENFSPCFFTDRQCSEYDALQKARGVCEKQNSCVACHEANSNCRWAAGTCTIDKNMNFARGCPTSETWPVVTPPPSSMCVDCIEGGGIWQAGKCTQCEDVDIGYCYETKESCSLWELRAVAMELCPQQRSCSECLYAHPHCWWMESTESCIGSVGQKLSFFDTIGDTEACPLPTTAQSTTTQSTTVSKSPTPGACADWCGCC